MTKRQAKKIVLHKAYMMLRSAYESSEIFEDFESDDDFAKLNEASKELCAELFTRSTEMKRRRK